ncbi:hypothetical protein [Anaerocolumna chitinilytica]|uniref:Uncharacterized protein n=1 Tax=Anaerocolumna chitinilytica TaxID=1727145 RepID=A0A7I8DG52_9FIRM|nr:hypothetical protein [Anaerocolumna chitinilytica]BCJ97468.1 hypothetical protein bsdcttw_05090 [Anaerocolumna chitinilytica]
MFKRLVVRLIAGILVFILIGLGYNILIGKPVTLNHYFTDHHVTYMKIGYTDKDGITEKTKELSQEELDSFLEQFGSYKIFKPFFRKTMIAKQNSAYISIAIHDEKKDFEVMFPLTDRGEVNLVRYTFYPYNTAHIDMYNYLLNLLDN